MPCVVVTETEEEDFICTSYKGDTSKRHENQEHAAHRHTHIYSFLVSLLMTGKEATKLKRRIKGHLNFRITNNRFFGT